MDRLRLAGRLHAYLGGCAKQEGVIPRIVGGVDDHVHMLVAIRATHRLSDVMRGVKANSSGFVHHEIGIRDFAWQDGYGAFAVNASGRTRVMDYIRNQEAHHRNETFRDEIVRLLAENEIVYDPRYLW